MSERLIVSETKAKGRGVFAGVNFAAGELVESCPVIVLPSDQRAVIDSTLLYDYYFSWGAEFKDAAICLGLGSLYNHSYKPNAQYVKDIAGGKINFMTLCAILVGEEITVNYNGSPDSLKPIWFEPIGDEP